MACNIAISVFFLLINLHSKNKRRNIKIRTWRCFTDKIIKIFGLWHNTNMLSITKRLRVCYKTTDHQPPTDHGSPTHRLSSHRSTDHQLPTNRLTNHQSPTTVYRLPDHWHTEHKLATFLRYDLFYNINNYLMWWNFYVPFGLEFELIIITSKY